MRKRKLETYFLHYRTKENSKFFVYAVRNCVIPEKTKEYKKLKFWLETGIVQACGYCDSGYYKEYRDLFISNLK